MLSHWLESMGIGKPQGKHNAIQKATWWADSQLCPCSCRSECYIFMTTIPSMVIIPFFPLGLQSVYLYIDLKKILTVFSSVSSFVSPSHFKYIHYSIKLYSQIFFVLWKYLMFFQLSFCSKKSAFCLILYLKVNYLSSSF